MHFSLLWRYFNYFMIWRHSWNKYQSTSVFKLYTRSWYASIECANEYWHLLNKIITSSAQQIWVTFNYYFLLLSYQVRNKWINGQLGDTNVNNTYIYIWKSALYNKGGQMPAGGLHPPLEGFESDKLHKCIIKENSYLKN